MYILYRLYVLYILYVLCVYSVNLMCKYKSILANIIVIFTVYIYIYIPVKQHYSTRFALNVVQCHPSSQAFSESWPTLDRLQEIVIWCDLAGYHECIYSVYIYMIYMCIYLHIVFQNWYMFFTLHTHSHIQSHT